MADLNLDQIISASVVGREYYQLTPIFAAPLRDPAAVAYRHEVFRDLEVPELKRSIEAFVAAMQRSRAHVERADKQRHALEKQRWTLDALLDYCQGVAGLSTDLERLQPESAALSAFRHYSRDYLESDGFISMRRRVEALADGLSALRYTVLIQGLDVRITPFADELDYGDAISEAFSRFSQAEDEQFSFAQAQGDSLNMIEERILDHVANAFPEVFAELAALTERYGVGFVDPVLEQLDREAQFYLGWRALIDPVAEAGHAFCYPEVTRDKDICADDAFDLALAHALRKRGDALVHNDVRLDKGERIVIVSGPNQGGKTTFARMFGQLHYLAALGLPVPGRRARLHLFDNIFTHFERREVSATADGKLQDELVRLHAILEAATGDSIVIMNELFASTTFRDASLLSRRVAKQLVERGVIGVWVSFLDGLSEIDPALVSMVSQVDPQDPAHRTFRVERHPADGLAYARAIAAKYRLTRAQIDRRVQA